MTDLSRTSTPSASKHLPLGQTQLVTVIVMGVVLWFAAAMLIRILAPMGIFEGSARILLYLLVIPGTWPFMVLIQRVARLATDQIAIGVSVATAAATLCDGIALAWFPWLYGSSVEHTAGAGAVILWGAGVGLVIAFFMNRVDRA
jgi:hypothetical protein